MIVGMIRKHFPYLERDDATPALRYAAWLSEAREVLLGAVANGVDRHCEIAKTPCVFPVRSDEAIQRLYDRGVTRCDGAANRATAGSRVDRFYAALAMTVDPTESAAP